MATQQFGYGPGVWAPAKGVGVVAIPKLLQPGAVTPEFKPENPYKALAAKAIGEMAYAHFLGGREEEVEEFKVLPDKDLSGKLMGSDGTFSKSIVDTIKKEEPEKADPAPYVFDPETADKTKRYIVTKEDGSRVEMYWKIYEPNQWVNEELGNLQEPHWKERRLPVEQNEGSLESIYTIDGITYKDGIRIN